MSTSQIPPVSDLPIAAAAFEPARAGRPCVLPPGKPWRDSGRMLFHLTDRIFGKPLCITRTKCDTILGVLGPRLGLAAEAVPPIVVQMDDDESDDESGYAIENGIACIPVHGTLVKRNGGLRAMSGLPSYESLRADMDRAVEDPAVKGICLDVDSPGGEASGCKDFADYLYSLRGQKPIYAVCNDQMCSAAYWIASMADQVYTTVDGMMGSIGCYMLHVDQSDYDKQRGLKFTYVQAGAKKTDGNAHEPLSDTAEVTMQQECNRIRDMFAGCVARARGCSVDDLLALEADVRFADAAIPLLADKVGTCADAMRDMRAQLGIPEAPDDTDDEDDIDLDEARETLAYDPWGEGTRAQEIAALDSGLQLLSVRMTQHMRDSLTPRLPMLDATRARFGLPPLFARMLGASGAQVQAIQSHKTATVDKPWDGPANEARLKTGRNAGYYRKAYAWQQDGSDGTKKNQFKFIHHEVSADGTPGAANIPGCRSGIEVINGARGGTTIPRKDRKGVYDHLARHMRDAGIEPPALKSEAELEAEELIARVALPALVSVQQLFERATTPGMHAAADLSSQSNPDSVLAVRCFGDSQIAKVESLPESDRRRIVCCVAPYNQLSADLGGFREIYAPGCFNEWLASGEDARALWNHNPDYVLGRRCEANTARFYEQLDGLYFECEAPHTTWADDLLESMRRRDVTGGSAAFFILQPRWEYRSGGKVRVIEKARLVEGSVASFPIYESSRASVQPAGSAVAAHAHTPLDLERISLELLRLR